MFIHNIEEKYAMLIVDGHLDLAWNALQWNRDLLASVYTIRTREANTLGKGRALNTVAFPDLRRGRVALCFGTIMVRNTGRPRAHVDFESVEQAYAISQSHQAYYHALAMHGHINLIEDQTDLARHLQQWQTWEAAPDDEPPPVGIVISMESADPILNPADLSQWWQQGLRIIGPAHQGLGRYVGGTGVEDGFTSSGITLLKTMQVTGMILDLTHLTDRAFWQALEHFGGAVLASHANSRTLVPHQRQFSDEQIRAIQARDGVIGVAFDNWMLVPGYIKDGAGNPAVTLQNVADHIDYLCQLTGSSQHCALGTDLDGGFGREQAPADLDTIADLQKLHGILSGRGYGEADIAAILHGNWIRILMAHLPTQ
jgi:membrane dipeptidase